MSKGLWLGLTAVSLLAAPRSADACLHGMEREVNPDQLLLTRAQVAVSRGDHATAMALLRNRYREQLSVEKITPVLVALQQCATQKGSPGASCALRQRVFTRSPVGRALRMVTLITARTDGRIALSKGTLTAFNRQGNLRWAAKLQRLLAGVDKSATMRNELAETLSRLPEGQREARTILSDNHRKDMLTSAEAFATLARLHAAAGDAKSRDEAVKRCQSMARDVKLCKVATDGRVALAQ